MKTITKENIINENVEFGIDSRYPNSKEKQADSVALMQARLERMKKLTKEQIAQAKLLQLKLKMENYINEPLHDNQNNFISFLESYIDTIYSKRNEFAKDINITPVFLSQVINHHREASEEFILKLMIHSEKTFKNIAPFQEKTWYQVYFQEKIYNTLSSQKKWRPSIEKQIKFKELI
ncbi:hypothetical protein [Chryseobacterium fistulae]|uniref:Uncharacterized protein n=1 Tax=Chryseobacterium fistulae TaxID=2675058 RepID=A0A6N4XQ66_9FLAO|nr:hypothetical protein [Chryseobacterium fistulae]CAA7385932.1 hypothetical protein CHRY9393_00221 [Chryseobacterium fistulae]